MTHIEYANLALLVNESRRVDLRLPIIEQVLSPAIEEYNVETRATLAARELIGDGINVHPGEKIGYVITNAKAKNKAERVSTSSHNGAAHYDRQEYAARLKAAAKEAGVIDVDVSYEKPGRAHANCHPLFPISD